MRTWKTVIACSVLCLGLWSVVPAEDEGDVDDSGDAQLQDAYEEHEKGGAKSTKTETGEIPFTPAAEEKPAPSAAKPEPKTEAKPEAKTEAEADAKADPESLVRGIRWLGHAGFLIDSGKTIYIDPFKIRDGLPAADIVLITHDHSDHLSPGDIGKILKESTVFVSVAAAKDKLPKKNEFRQVQPRDTLTIEGVRIEAVRAYNVKVKFHPKDQGLVGYVVTVGGRRIYHAGDTELIPEMSSIKADVALLPVGGTYTMDAAEAAKAVEAIKPKVAIPMHYGTIIGRNDDARAFKSKSKVPVVILEADVKAEPKPAGKAEQGKE